MNNLPEGKINFFKQDCKFVFKQKTKIKEWIIYRLNKQNYILGDISYIFCSDDYLLKLNQTHLNHDTYTDIITFDYSSRKKIVTKKIISGEIYISIERVKENAKLYDTIFNIELYRVMSHGILHLLGYKDKTDEEQKIMRLEEDKGIAFLFKIKTK